MDVFTIGCFTVIASSGVHSIMQVVVCRATLYRKCVWTLKCALVPYGDIIRMKESHNSSVSAHTKTQRCKLDTMMHNVGRLDLRAKEAVEQRRI